MVVILRINFLREGREERGLYETIYLSGHLLYGSERSESVAKAVGERGLARRKSRSLPASASLEWKQISSPHNEPGKFYKIKKTKIFPLALSFYLPYRRESCRL